MIRDVRPSSGKGRWSNPSQHKRRNDEIRNSYALGVSTSELAETYGLTRRMVQKVISQGTARELPQPQKDTLAAPLVIWDGEPTVWSHHGLRLTNQRVRLRLNNFTVPKV